MWILAEFILRRTGSTVHPFHWWFALVLALAPIQLVYERFILTECLTAFFFSAYLAIAVRYLVRPRIVWLGVLAALSFVLVALRVSILPNILLGLIGMPLLAFLPFDGKHGSRSDMLRRMGTHLLLFLMLTGGALWCYQQTYAKLSGQPPGYHSRQGFFLLATISPLLTREDFADPNLQAAVFAPGGFDLRNADLRNVQLFATEGLLPRMERHLGDPISTDRLARQIALRAILKHPIAFFRLGWQNARLYLDRKVLTRLVRKDLGDRPVSAVLQERLARHFHCEYRPFDGKHSVTSGYFAKATWWFGLLILASIPVGLSAFIGFWRGHCATAFVGLHLLVSIGVSVWLAPAESVRYLHLVELLFILTVGLLVVEVYCWRRAPGKGNRSLAAAEKELAALRAKP